MRFAVSFACLTASQALFLWMFLAADPLEQLATTGRFRTLDSSDGAGAALEFAAAWRHGMAGNSPLYMPGFFVTAVAMWLHAAGHGTARALMHALAAALLGLPLAAAFAPFGAPAVIGAFSERHALPLPGPVPLPSVQAAAVGCYTLFTWSVFVVCARASLVRRTLRPLAIPAGLTVVLSIVRPWTADEFSSFWARQVIAGEPVASCSLLGAVACSAALVSFDVKRRHRSVLPQPDA